MSLNFSLLTRYFLTCLAAEMESEKVEMKLESNVFVLSDNIDFFFFFF